jgi:pilus assembly protein Flp/PilA
MQRPPSRIAPGARRNLSRIMHDRRGVTTIEYGLIIAFIVLVIFAALVALAGQTTAMWTNISTRVQAVS